METKESKEPFRPKNAVQLLLSRVDNMRNDMAMIRNRVENLEKSLPALKDYIKDQMIELYSQIEAARETMDEITSFFEEMNREEEEEESEDMTDTEMDSEEINGDETEVTELELPDDNNGYYEFPEGSELPIEPSEDGTEEETY